MKFSISILAFFLTIGVLAQSSDSTFVVGLKNGTIYYPGTLKMKTPIVGRAHLLLNKDQRIDLDKVKYYQDATGYYVFKNIDGFRETRLKREVQGRVNTYSRIVDTYSPGFTGPNGIYTPGNFNSAKLEYYQVGDGGIYTINYENLSKALKNNPQSVASLKRVKSLKNLNTAAYIVGSALVVGGLAHMGSLNEKEGPPPYDTTIKWSPFFFLGAATLTIPLFTKAPKQKRLREAIDAYNQ